MTQLDFYDLMDFSKQLAVRPLVLASGIATRLHRLGYDRNEPAELATLKSDDALTQVYRNNLESGADIVVTNTFSGNRHQLSSHGYGHKIEAINSIGVRTAKAISSGKAFVAASLGPTGKPRKSEEIFQEQIEFMEPESPDCYFLETMTSLLELRNGVTAVRKCSNKPIIATVTLSEKGTLLDGSKLDEAAAVLNSLELAAYGVGCGHGPSSLFAGLCKIAQAANGPLIFAPNTMNGGDPGTLADYASQALNIGTRIIGGCCGTTSAHLVALRQVVLKL